MQNALKRLLELREELERLHQTTARVLAESEHLIEQVNRSSDLDIVNAAPARQPAPRRTRKPRPRRPK